MKSRKYPKSTHIIIMIMIIIIITDIVSWQIVRVSVYT